MSGQSTIRLYQTARDTTDRLTEKKLRGRWDKAPLDSDCIIYLEPGMKYQEIIGFGGAFTESAADSLHRVSPANRRKALEAYFHPSRGINYTFCRTHINSCDFSLSNYACCDTAGDTELKTFNIDRERKVLLPVIRQALSIRSGPIRIFASPWSPPAWMKTNREMNHGGRLIPKYRNAWARYYAKFIKAFRAEGVPIWGLTIQNEPQAVQRWDSCVWTAREEGDFVMDHLGPVLRSEGLAAVKVMIWDHNKDHLLDRVRESLKDPRTANLVWGVGFHWYNGDFFEHLDAVHELFPSKPLVFTEGCNEFSRGPGGWHWAERYGHEILGDLNHWAAAWCDWNLVLDEKGGPNHVGNFCDAPIIADTKKDRIDFHNSFYYIAHFSRFILPGSRRIGHARSMDRLETASFRNRDGSIALVVLNRTDDGMEFKVKLGSRAFGTSIPARAIQTYLIG